MHQMSANQKEKLLTIVDTNRKLSLLNSVQEFIEIVALLHLTFFLCLHNQLISASIN